WPHKAIKSISMMIHFRAFSNILLLSLRSLLRVVSLCLIDSMILVQPSCTEISHSKRKYL
ncbi:hypothetical protein HDU99_002442, partial [Rhizoclosmatium hyalinum]